MPTDTAESIDPNPDSRKRTLSNSSKWYDVDIPLARPTVDVEHSRFSHLAIILDLTFF